MSDTKDGAQAFPLKGPLLSSDNLGMTLRDYFAAKAMQAMISEGSHYGVQAESAYRMADAMLAERGRK